MSSSDQTHQPPQTQRDRDAHAQRKSTMLGFFLMIFSGFIFSLLAVIYHRTAQLGYSSMQILQFRGIVQVSLALFVGLTSFKKKVANKRNNYNTSINSNSENINNNNTKCTFFRLTCTFKCKWNELLQHSRQLPKMIWVWVFCRGFFGALGAVGYTHSVTVLPIGDSIAVFSLYPIFTAFFARIILKEKLTINHIIALIISIFGVMMISQPSFLFKTPNSNLSKNEHIMGYGSALFGAFWVGSLFIFIKLAKGANVMFLVISHGLFCIIEGIIMMLLFQKFEVNGLFVNPSVVSWCLMISIGFIGYIGQWTLNKSAQLIPAGISSLLRSSDMIWTYIWQIIFFDTMPNVFTVIGALSIFTGICMVSYEKFKKIHKTTGISTHDDDDDDELQDTSIEINSEIADDNININIDKGIGSGIEMSSMAVVNRDGIFEKIKEKISQLQGKKDSNQQVKYDQLKPTSSMMSLTSGDELEIDTPSADGRTKSNL